MKVKATKLVEGNQYYFRAYAENAVGVSGPAEMEEPVTAKLPFGKYLIFNITVDLSIN